MEYIFLIKRFECSTFMMKVELSKRLTKNIHGNDFFSIVSFIIIGHTLVGIKTNTARAASRLWRDGRHPALSV